MKRALMILLFVLCLCCIATSSLALTLPDGLTTIEDEAFSGDRSLKGVLYLTAGISQVGTDAFSGTELFAMHVPVGTESLGNQTFVKAAYVYINDSGTKVGQLTNVQYIIAPAGSFTQSAAASMRLDFVAENTLIEHDGFYYQDNGNGLTLLSAKDATQIDTDVQIPEEIGGKQVIAISPYAFIGCTKLTVISLPIATEETVSASATEDCAQAAVSFYGEIIHVPGELAYDETHHWNKCIGCSEVRLNITKHEGGAATCIAQAVCETCLQPYGEKLDHEFSEEWKSNKDGHWHICTTCEKKTSDAASHTFSEKWSASGTEHWHECEVCAYKTDVTEHAFTGAWQKNADEHWKICACGVVAMRGTHNPGPEATEAAPQVCTECHYVMAVAAETPVQYFTYTIEDGEVTITKFDKSCGVTNVVVPEKIEGYPVTCIGDWAFNECKTLTSIILPDGLTTIEFRAFYGCSSLTSIIIPDSVIQIENAAFYGCTSMTSITISGSCCRIGDDAFTVCSSLTHITIPDSVTSIGANAFSRCTSLTSITLPDSVTSIGAGAFDRCTSLTSISIPNAVTSIAEGTFSECTSLTSITIPDSVTSIGGSAFWYCTALTNITIPDSVTSIGSYAFEGCYVLASIHLPDSLSDIGTGAFMDCEALTSIIIPPSVTRIGGIVFKDCRHLASVTIPSGVTRINSDAFDGCPHNLTFYGYAGSYTETYANDKGIAFITLVAEPPAEYFTYTIENDGVTITGYDQSYPLTAILIPAKIEGYPVTSIGSMAFADCEKLIRIDLPAGITTIGNSAFYKCGKVNRITLPDGLTTIGIDAFRNCSSLTSINIPDSVTSIPNGMFRDCSSLTSIIIPNSVTRIGEEAFRNCRSLTSITLSEFITGINWATFQECIALKSVRIPNSVQFIHDEAFRDCPRLTRITIPSGVFGFGRNIFSGCSGKLIIAGEAGSYAEEYAAQMGFTFEYISNEEAARYFYYKITNGEVTIIDFDESSGVTDVVVPEKIAGYPVTSIGTAFSGFNALTSITLPNSITAIEAGAFSGCWKLPSIVIPDSVTSIEGGAFSDCRVLTSVTLPNSNLYISSNPFTLNTVLKEIIISPEHPTLETINGALFDKAEKRLICFYGGGHYVVPQGTLTIGPSAFMDRSGLTGITIPDSVTSIGSNAFSYCSNLTEITIPDGITSIGSGMFFQCFSLASVTIPDSVTSIERDAFYDCNSLTSITIPDSVTSIGVGAFESCDKLTSITIPSSVTSIGNKAFEKSSEDLIICGYAGSYAQTYAAEKGIAFVTIRNEDNLAKNFTYAIENGTATITGLDESYGMTDVVFPQRIRGFLVTSIGDFAFRDCTGITSITIPGIVTKIGNGAFANCTQLKKLTLYGNNDHYKIDSDTLYTKDGLTLIAYPAGKTATSYDIPKGTTNIAGYAFSGCDALTSITIPDSVTSIGEGAFAHCSSLPSITIPSSVISIGSNAFEDCSDDLIVYGYAGSYAEDYANQNGFTFVVIVDETPAQYFTYNIANNEVTITSFDESCGVTDVVVPQKIAGYPVTSIGDYAFCYCISITSITIPDSVSNIGNGAFSCCTQLKSIILSGNNDHYKTVSDVLFTKDGLTLTAYPAGKTDTSYDIPESTTSIAEDAFSGCENLTSITIPNSVTSIRDYAFYSCSSLTSITIPDSVTSIEDGTFAYCSSLTSITIPSSVISISTDAFYFSPDDLIIYGYTGSYAETYAAKNGLTFVAIV